MTESPGTRERILDAAERLFAERGFDATSTSSIAELANVPKGLVFYYFPRKVDILRALLDERLPASPLCEPRDVVRRGDPVGSLLRLARRLGLGDHDSVVLRTMQALDAQEPTATNLVCLAKAKAGDVARLATNEAVQMHGGIGMTDEFDIGFFMKRARAAGETLGDSYYHTDRFAQLSGY